MSLLNEKNADFESVSVSDLEVRDGCISVDCINEFTLDHGIDLENEIFHIEQNGNDAELLIGNSSLNTNNVFVNLQGRVDVDLVLEGDTNGAGANDEPNVIWLRDAQEFYNDITLEDVTGNVCHVSSRDGTPKPDTVFMVGGGHTAGAAGTIPAISGSTAVLTLLGDEAEVQVNTQLNVATISSIPDSGDINFVNTGSVRITGSGNGLFTNTITNQNTDFGVTIEDWEVIRTADNAFISSGILGSPDAAVINMVTDSGDGLTQFATGVSGGAYIWTGNDLGTAEIAFIAGNTISPTITDPRVNPKGTTGAQLIVNDTGAVSVRQGILDFGNTLPSTDNTEYKLTAINGLNQFVLQDQPVLAGLTFSGANQTQLTDYEEFEDTSTLFTGIWATDQAGVVRIVRNGNAVTVSVSTAFATANTATQIDWLGAVPTRLRPPAAAYGHAQVLDNVVSRNGVLLVSGGVITIFSTSTTGVLGFFAGSGSSGSNYSSVTYCLDL